MFCNFQPGFRKFWKKLFLSEASVAVMQDTFWWFFLNRFDVSTERSYSGKALPEQINCKRFCSIVCSGPIDMCIVQL